MASDEQPRESGRFAPKARPPESPRERTATEILADARKRGDQHLIPQPMPWAELNDVIVFHGLIGEERTGQWRRNTERLEAMKGWLKATAAHPEGLSSDLWRIWQTWNPIPYKPKEAIRGLFDGLDRACMRKEAELGARSEKERNVLMAAEHKRRAIEAARKDIEDVEQQLAVEVPAELEKRRGRLAELEAMA